jgi:hypothetical protein
MSYKIGDFTDPRELRWADPNKAARGPLSGQQEIVIALLNLTTEVARIADHLTGEGEK